MYTLADYTGFSVRWLNPADPPHLFNDRMFKVNPRRCNRLSIEKLETRRLLALTPQLRA